ncbi:MAG: hypothetical protein H7Y11_07495 [Armatimonadetes bacterium]|nr:hypothetical protein [Anaerolineae bacterium]
MNFSLANIIVDGVILSIGLSIIVLGSMRFNPRLWLRDYPPEVQAVVAPVTPIEKRQQQIVMVLFMAVSAAVLFVSLSSLHAANNGNPAFLALFLNLYGVLIIFNITDAVILDYLILMRMKPRFAVIPGSEAVYEASFPSLQVQMGDFLKGCVIIGVVSLVVAGLVTVF